MRKDTSNAIPGLQNNSFKNKTFSLGSVRLWKSAESPLWYPASTLTFAHTGAVHHPDEWWTVFTVCGDAVLRGLEYVAVVLLHLQRAAEQRFLLSLPAYVLSHLCLLFWSLMFFYRVTPKSIWRCRGLAVSNDENEDRLTISASFFLRFLRSGLTTCCNKKRQNRRMFCILDMSLYV